ncbi:MAG: type II toxin-antitoxin system RelE/ParE family toxin [Terracidiphilus sp.]
MEIRWSIPAAEDLERICTWIERDRPEAAKRVAATIYNGIAQLSNVPGLGRTSSRVSGWRELVFAPLPYIAVYRVSQNAIESARIFDGAQDWP